MYQVSNFLDNLRLDTVGRRPICEVIFFKSLYVKQLASDV